MNKSSDELLRRCTFPRAGSALPCAFSGGTDSTALLALALAAGCRPVAHHVDHGIRAESGDDAERARSIAGRLGVPFVLHRTVVEPGPNLEARARESRYRLLPAAVATGHTADDQAETVLLRLLRGAATTGLGAIGAGPQHPILGLRRSETVAVCRALGIDPVHDRSNESPDVRRNRVRSELIPLADDIAQRDVVPLLHRTAELLREDDAFLDELAASIDPTDAVAVASAPPVLARRALRRWLTQSGYPPDRASIDRVLAVAHGEANACEITGGRRVERSQQHFRIVETDR